MILDGRMAGLGSHVCRSRAVLVQLKGQQFQMHSFSITQVPPVFRLFVLYFFKTTHSRRVIKLFPKHKPHQNYQLFNYCYFCFYVKLHFIDQMYAKDAMKTFKMLKDKPCKENLLQEVFQPQLTVN